MNTHNIMRLMPEVLAALKATGQNVSLAKDLEAAIEHDRKGRGEPVAWPRNAKEIRDFIDTHFISMTGGDEASDDDKYLLTAHDLLSAFDWWTDFAPQPVESIAKKSLTRDERQLVNWLLRDPTTGDCLVFASAPVNEGSFAHVRMRSESGEDWTLTVRLKQGWLTAEQRAANFWSAAKAEQEEQPAEPVKVPSETVQPLLDTIEILCNGLEWNIENHPDIMTPADDEALGAARTLLARYGQPRGNPS